MKNWFQAALGGAPTSMPAQATEQKAAPQPLVALQFTDAISSGLSRCQWSGRDYSALAREGYQKNAVVFRCVRLIAEAAASVSLCVRRGEVCEDSDPAERLLSRGHAGASAQEIMEQFYGYLQVHGNAYLEAGLSDGVPVAIYALRPDRLRCVTGPNGWPSGWEYEAGGYKRRFRIDKVTGRSCIFHARLFNPLDDQSGHAPLSAAANAMDIHNVGARWTKALLDNAARPSGALIYKGTSGSDRLSDDQFDRLKSELDGAHSGARNAGRPMVLEGGLDWKAMSFSPADMDFMDARRDAAREIALAFGVPPMLLGIPGDNSYANYKEANLAFWRQTVLPLVGKTARGMQAWLQPFYGEDLRLVPDLDQVHALSEERSQLWARLSGASFMSDAERRKLAGLPARDIAAKMDAPAPPEPPHG
jgi:HK97 family phage portal protein